VFEDFQIRFKAGAREIPPKTNIFAFDTHWYLPCPRNHFFFYIRVNVSSEDDACIKVTLSLPLIPSFRIYNSLQEPLQIKQSKTKTETEVIPAGSSLPFAFFDNTLKNKKVTLKILSHKKRYSLEKIKEKNKDLGPFLVSIDFEGECRVLRIYEAEETVAHLEISLMKKVIEKSTRKTEVKLAGVHFSLLDQENNEKFLLSFQEFHWKMTRNEEKRNKQAKVRVKYHLILAGLQIDNMKVDRHLFPVMAFHSQINEMTPWCEFRYDREFTTGSIESKYFTPIDRILEFELQMQPLTLNLNLETVFSFTALSGMYYNHFYNSSEKSTPSYCRVSEAFPQLNPFIPFAESCPRSIKSYFKYIRIHGSKFVVTFSNSESTSESNHSDMSQSLSEFILDLANIENSNLKFTEIILQYSFQNFSNLFTILIKNYIRQGLLQFYRILGSSELLGNPIGLIDKLGTGVYEFFNEPAKGLLQGPKGFVAGVGKGVKSLVSNVIGGSFESVSKITGSLYKIVGQEKKPAVNVYQKLGLQDLAAGVTGIVMKPYLGLKTKGAAGLVLGVGTGVFGALVSPVAAVLHFSSTVSSEVAKTANKLHHFQSHRGRVRFPRFLNNKKILERYDHHLAKVRFFVAVKEFKDSDIQALVELVKEFVILTKDKMFIIVGEEIVDEHLLSEFYIKEVHSLQKQFILKLSNSQKSICISSELYAPIFKLFTAIKLSNYD
jgi:vacuolar protein sorting-associated protein 13A/C